MKDATCVSGDGYKDLCQEVARESLEADVGAENIIKQGLMSWDGRLLFNVLDMLKKVDPATPRGDHLRRTQQSQRQRRIAQFPTGVRAACRGLITLPKRWTARQASSLCSHVVHPSY